MASNNSNQFTVLSPQGNEFETWEQNISNHLLANELSDTLDENFDDTSARNKKRGAQSLIFILKHLCDELQSQYISYKNPKLLISDLRERCSHHRVILKPATLHEWNHLRFQDFRTVADYTTALYNIVSKLRTCKLDAIVTEENLIEKTLSTFPLASFNISEQLRFMNFTKYSQLLAALLVSEQHQTVLMKNDKLHPVGIAPREPEIQDPVSFFTNSSRKHYTQQNRQLNEQPSNYNNYYSSKPKFKRQRNKWPKQSQCNRCGLQGHWQSTCRTHEFHVQVYKELLDLKAKEEHNQNESNAASFLTQLRENSRGENRSESIDNSENTSERDFMNFMTLAEPIEEIPDTHCIVDSASTHSILKEKSFFEKTEPLAAIQYRHNIYRR
jgi:hypothetical protein